MNTKKNQILSFEKDKLSFTLLGYCFSIGFFILLFSLTTSSTYKEPKNTSSFTEDEFVPIPPVILEIPKPIFASEKIQLNPSTSIVIGEPLDTSSHVIDPFVDNNVLQPIINEPSEIIIPPVIKPFYTPVELTDLPSFVGGDKALNLYFENNLSYPKMAIESGIEGVINVLFIVETDGSLSNIHIDSKSAKLGSGCETEAIKVIRNMPKWLPGKVKNKNVRVLCSMPITFSLEDID